MDATALLGKDENFLPVIRSPKPPDKTVRTGKEGRCSSNSRGNSPSLLKQVNKPTNPITNYISIRASKRPAGFNEIVEISQSPCKKVAGTGSHLDLTEPLSTQEDIDPSLSSDSGSQSSIEDSLNVTVVQSQEMANEPNFVVTPVLDDPTLNPQLREMLLLILSENRSTSTKILENQKETSHRLTKLENFVKSSNSGLKKDVEDVKGKVKAVTEDLSQAKSSFEARLLQLENLPAQTSDKSLIKALADKIEMQERCLKKKNILIKGLLTQPTTRREVITNFLSDKFNYTGSITDIRTAGKIADNNTASMVVVTLDSFEEKKRILRNKKLLLNQQSVDIQPDLTAREQTCMFQLRNFARTQQPDGNNVWYDHLLVKVTGCWYKWDEESERVVPAKFTRKSPPARMEPQQPLESNPPDHGSGQISPTACNLSVNKSHPKN